MEFFVPLEHGQDALRAIWRAVKEKGIEFSPPWGYQHDAKDGGDAPPRGIVDAMEFRQVKAGDGSWLSPHNVNTKTKSEAYLGIHISFNGDPALRNAIQEEYLPVIERALKPYLARPHWGKLATSDIYCYSGITALYGKVALEGFQALCQKHDPAGKFRNEFVETCLFDTK